VVGPIGAPHILQVPLPSLVKKPRMPAGDRVPFFEMLPTHSFAPNDRPRRYFYLKLLMNQNQPRKRRSCFSLGRRTIFWNPTF
jgi:hypothetical protein